MTFLGEHPRHYDERSDAAIQTVSGGVLDCRAPLAMTDGEVQP